MAIRAVIERGPKDRKSAAYAPDWPGWSRGGKTVDLAFETLADSFEEASHAECCVVLDLLHIELNDIASIVLNEIGDQIDAFLELCIGDETVAPSYQLSLTL